MADGDHAEIKDLSQLSSTCLNTPIYLNVLAEFPALGAQKIHWLWGLCHFCIVPYTQAPRRPVVVNFRLECGYD